MPGTFSPPPRVSDLDMHHGTCVTGSLTSSFLWIRWRGKRSWHSRRMRNPQFYVSGKRPIGSEQSLTPNRWRAIIWTHGKLFYWPQMGPVLAPWTLLLWVSCADCIVNKGRLRIQNHNVSLQWTKGIAISNCIQIWLVLGIQCILITAKILPPFLIFENIQHWLKRNPFHINEIKKCQLWTSVDQ